VLADGRPALIDFQLAVRARPRSRWLRLLAREDLRHLLKHKRTYCREALTPVERRLLRRRSWVREAWFATGKPSTASSPAVSSSGGTTRAAGRGPESAS
jgi:hypothetical protein